MARVRRLSQADWNRFHGAATKRAEKISNQFISGKITAEVWREKFETFLADRHGYAAYMGRRRAGDFTPRHDGDKEFGAGQAETQKVFVDDFENALRTGKYLSEAGELDADWIRERSGMYVDVMRGTANETFVGASDPDEYFNWNEGAAEKHCEVCPSLSAGSPYRIADLPSFPGDGSTPCLFACLCSLERISDGLRGFGPVD
jgi:hypothetical protein